MKLLAFVLIQQFIAELYTVFLLLLELHSAVKTNAPRTAHGADSQHVTQIKVKKQKLIQILYRVFQFGRSIFQEVILPVILNK
jgi:hypothetical protein